jgi:hypothetical protein
MHRSLIRIANFGQLTIDGRKKTVAITIKAVRGNGAHTMTKAENLGIRGWSDVQPQKSPVQLAAQPSPEHSTADAKM